MKLKSNRSVICIMSVALAGMLCSSLLALAGELGHYMPGVANIRDFAVPSDPGFYYVQYNLYYTTDTYNDRNGKSVDSLTIGNRSLDIDVDIDAYAIQPTFIWATDIKIFGARYAPFIGIPVTSTSVQAALSTTTSSGQTIDDTAWGVGDIYLKPIWLGWNTTHFGGSVGYGLYAPTGRYDNEARDNTGLGFWTHEIQAGLTWYPWKHKGTAVMVNGTYEIHHEKDGADITPGERFSLDWGVSQYLPVNSAETLLMELGVTGYSQWQVNEDSGADVINRLNVKDEVHGIGGQVGLAYVPWNASLSLRYVSEYNAEARFEGDLFTLTLAKGF